jgi:hypothetical protein
MILVVSMRMVQYHRSKVIGLNPAEYTINPVWRVPHHQRGWNDLKYCKGLG